MRFSDLEGRRIGVWGAGREISSLARQMASRTPRASIAVAAFDDPPPSEQARRELHSPQLRLVPAPEAAAALAQCELVVRSPGVSSHRPELRELRAAGVPVTTATSLWLCEHGPGGVIGVSGTKGKSTTAALTAHLARAAGTGVALAGNIGVPALDLLDAEPAPLTVLELSSYQIADLDCGPEVALFTNLFKEHTDWHGSEERYRSDKLRLLALPGVRVAVLNARDPGLAAAVRELGLLAGATPNPPARAPTGATVDPANGATADPPAAATVEPPAGATVDPPTGATADPPAGATVDPPARAPAGAGPEVLSYGTADGWDARPDGLARAGELVVEAAQLPLPGEHNALNLCGALTALQALGVHPPLPGALAGFQPLEHRLQRVAEQDGVVWVDDSISTTPESTLAALASFPGRRLVLIAGGQDRGQDYAALATAIARSGASVIGVPSTGARLVAAAVGAGVPAARAREAEDLSDAVAMARSLAESGTVVLLSPAAPSFDHYRDFEERGERFSALALAGRSA